MFSSRRLRIYMMAYLQELSNSIHPDEEFLIEVESLAAILLVHVEVLLQQVYNAIVVAREQSAMTWNCIDD